MKEERKPKPDGDASTSTSSPSPTPPALPLPRVVFAVTGFGPFAGVAENPTQRVVEGLRRRAREDSPSPSPPPFSLARSLVKTDVLRVSAADAERFVRVDLEEAAREVASRAKQAEAETKAAKTATTDASPPLPLCHFVAVHLGVYPSGTAPPRIRLETRAHNCADFRVPDADGKVLLREAITRKNRKASAAAAEEERARRLESGLPLSRVASRLSSREPASSSPYSVETTSDAGRYLCNFIYWHSLCACEEKDQKRKPLLSSLWPPQLRRRRERREKDEEEARFIRRHAVFVHLPPAAVLPVDSQLDFVERLLRVLAEELVEE